jgi:hypothetical protein
VRASGALGALLALLPTCWHADATAGGLCAATETTFFACQTRQRKWISLCGSVPRTLQYRFGTVARTELSFPDDPAVGLTRFEFAHYFRYQTDRTEVSFHSGEVDYAVFDYTEHRKRSAGVRVTPADGREREFACRGRIESALQKLNGVLRCDPDNALNPGGCR